MIKYICDICGKEFDTEKSLRVRNIYVGDATKISSVDMCNKCCNELTAKIADLEYSFYKEKRREV